MPSRARKHFRIALRVAGFAALLCLLVFAYGTSAEDIRRVKTFMDACPRWQTNPDFRRVADEYIRTGSAALRTRVAFLPANRVLLGLRSVPFLPANLAAEESSQGHYEDFAAGELSSYFRLSSEQGTRWVIPLLEGLVRDGELSDERLRVFLARFRTAEPLATDAGAIEGLRRLIADIRPSQPLTVRDAVATKLQAASSDYAKELSLPAAARDMTPAQQFQVYAGLDGYVRRQDPELWRSKQVSDFLVGIWAQTFGQTYARWTGPIVPIWYAARIVGPLWLFACVALLLRRWQRRSSGATAPH